MIMGIKVSPAEFRRVCKEIGINNNGIIKDAKELRIKSKNDSIHIGKHGNR